MNSVVSSGSKQLHGVNPCIVFTTAVRYDTGVGISTSLRVTKLKLKPSNFHYERTILYLT